MSRRAALTYVAADVAFAATIISLLALIVATLMRPDLNIIRDAFSFYAVGPWAAVQTAAFAAMGIASLGLAIALLTASTRTGLCRGDKGVILSTSEESLRNADDRSISGILHSVQDDTGCDRDSWRMLSAVLLVLSAVACFALIWFPMGEPSLATFIGDTHQTAGTIGGIAQLAATLSFARATRNDAQWQHLFVPITVTFVVSLVGAVLTQIAIWRPDLGIPMGAAMRLVVLPLILLWSAVAWRLRQDCAAST